MHFWAHPNTFLIISQYNFCHYTLLVAICLCICKWGPVEFFEKDESAQAAISFPWENIEKELGWAQQCITCYRSFCGRKIVTLIESFVNQNHWIHTMFEKKKWCVKTKGFHEKKFRIKNLFCDLWALWMPIFCASFRFTFSSHW